MVLRALLIHCAAISLACVTLAACGGDQNKPEPEIQFEYLGLDGHKVSRFTSYDDDEALYAATDKGLFTLSDGSWQLTSPATWEVNSIVALYPSHLLASITLDGEHKLMESLNTGTDWSEVTSNFGGEQGTSLAEPALNMLFNEHTGILYGVGYGVFAKSEDFGRSWTAVDGQWQTLARGLSALNYQEATGAFWFGGQGAIENPILRQVPAMGDAINHSQRVAELLEVPSTVKAIRFAEDNWVLVSGEGGIIESTDGGSSWQDLHTNENSRFYFDVVPNPENTNTLYTAGWNKNFDDPQPLILEISHDKGATWEEIEYEDDKLRGGVWSMTLRNEGGKQMLYLGLCNGGVFRVAVSS